MIQLGIVGDHNPQYESHKATDMCIPLATAEMGIDVETQWISTRELSTSDISSFDALIVATGVYEDQSAVLDALRMAREGKIPTLAMCGGFQFMIIEYARNVLGLKEVGHAEFDSGLKEHIIAPLQCSLRGLEAPVSILRDSQVGEIYQAAGSEEKFYCSFGLAPRYAPIFADSPLRFVGYDYEGQLRITELPVHPFFIGTLFVPQARALKGSSHPLINELLRVACKRRQGLGGLSSAQLP